MQVGLSQLESVQFQLESNPKFSSRRSLTLLGADKKMTPNNKTTATKAKAAIAKTSPCFSLKDDRAMAFLSTSPLQHDYQRSVIN
jgi:hypothetical protein